MTTAHSNIMGEPVTCSTGTRVARYDESRKEIHDESIIAPKFVRSLPTVKLPLLAEEIYQQNVMVEQQKTNSSEMQFENSLCR